MPAPGPDDARTRWNRRWAARAVEDDGDGVRDGDGDAPAVFLTARADLLPAGGRALDVAGGTGRHARWLAERGFAVTLVDVSDVAVDRVTRQAAAEQLAITAIRADLPDDPLPEGPFAVVLDHHHHDALVWAALPSRLAPGGVLLLCQPTTRNLDRHRRPSRRWLLPEGAAEAIAHELAAADDGLEVVEAREGWTAQGRHEAHLVIRRTG